MRAKIDYDYLDQLTEAEREWLADFTAAHYDADFRRAPKEDWGPAQRSVANTAKHAARRDHYAYLENGGLLRNVDARHRDGGRRYEIPDLPGDDESPSPDYLDSDPYKEARTVFRRTLGPQDRTPKPTPEHLAAVARLKTTTPDQSSSTEDPDYDHAQDPQPRSPAGRPPSRRPRK